MPRKKKEEVFEEELLPEEEPQQETHWTAFIVPTIILIFVFVFVGAYIYVTGPNANSDTGSTQHEKNEERSATTTVSSSNSGQPQQEEDGTVYLARDIDSSVIRKVSGPVIELGNYALADDQLYYRYNPAEGPYILLITIAENTDSFSLVEDSRYYATHGERVYFVKGDDTFAPRHNTLFVVADADPSSFELVSPNSGNTLKQWLARDAEHVFYQHTIIPDADPASFTTTEYISINKDADHVFLWNKIVPGADPDTYEVVFDTSAASIGTVFGRDADACYRDYEQINCEAMPETYEEARGIEI